MRFSAIRPRATGHSRRTTCSTCSWPRASWSPSRAAAARPGGPATSRSRPGTTPPRAGWRRSRRGWRCGSTSGRPARCGWRCRCPARDGSLVVDGWAATRFEPGTTPCRDLATLRATAHLLHAHLASAVPERPGRARRAHRPVGTGRASGVRRRRGRRGGCQAPRAGPGRARRAARGRAGRHRPRSPSSWSTPTSLATSSSTPPVPRSSSTSPPPGARRCGPRRSACSTRCCGSVRRVTALDDWRTGVERQAMLRAALFRVLSDEPCDVARYQALDLA